MTDLFKANTDLETPENDNYLEQLVGPGKKYADVNALAKAASHQIPYIKRLEEENEQARQELQKRLSIEEYVQQMKTEIAQSRVPSEDDQRPVTQISKEDIKKELFSEFETLLSTQNKKALAERNVELVRNELQKVWGSTYPAQLKSKAQELNLTEEFLGNLAQDNPQAFLKIVGVSGSPKVIPQSIPTNSRNSAYRTDANESTDRNKAYYDKLKKDNPKLYWTAKIQAQEHRDAVRLGDAFFN